MFCAADMKQRITIPKSIASKDRYGQVFLTDSSWLNREVEVAALSANDRVLEVGPAFGNLSKLIAPRVQQLHMIEIDRRFKPTLTELCSEFPNVSISWGDASIMKLPSFNKVVSNLPYNVAFKILCKIVLSPFDLGVFVIQDDMAARIVARPGSPGYSRASVTIQAYYSARRLFKIPKNAFSPTPAVQSACIKLERARPVKPLQEAFFKNALDLFFMDRNLPIGRIFREDSQQLRLGRLYSALPLSIRERPVYEVSPPEFLELCRLMFEAGINPRPISDRAKQTRMQRR
jgi:16S rRNA (adenine1518-N6/adenine1519-N6)-dimethyltransferase